MDIIEGQVIDEESEKNPTVEDGVKQEKSNNDFDESEKDERDYFTKKEDKINSTKEKLQKYYKKIKFS